MRIPQVGELVTIDRKEAQVTAVNVQRRTLHALLTRKTNPMSYAGRPWSTVELHEKEN